MTESNVVGSAPVLMVKDVVRSAEFYRDSAGFEICGLWGEPPCFGILGRGEWKLMLRLAGEKPIAPNHQAVGGVWNAYFWVRDVDTEFMNMRDAGAEFVYEVSDQPHGCREFAFVDPDGYHIAFGQDLD